MSCNPLGTPKFRWSTASGAPLSGGLLYTYAAGTTTLLSTYTTRAGSVANANPVVLDANGEANVWLTPGVDYKFVLQNSGGVVQWTVDNYPSPVQASATTDEVATNPGGRLTLSTGIPVTTGDVTGAGTIYYSPYLSAKLPLYDGTNWALYDFSELSQSTGDITKSPAAVLANTNYDLFVWNDSGTLRCTRGPAWTSSTARGTGAGTTELQQVNGRWVNKVSISNGPAAQHGLYVGTVRSDGSALINDSVSKRHVWNMYNRRPRVMRVLESADNWEYHTGTWRQARASATNQLDVVRGLDEDLMAAKVRTQITAVAAGAYGLVGIGLDATNALTTGCTNNAAGASGPNTVYSFAGADWSGYPGLGRHFLAWIEKGDGGANNINWQGDQSDGTSFGAGIHGECWA
jgi:hypothetical protein